MSMNDPIADMLTRIRNAQATNKKSVTMPSSNGKIAIAKVLEDEGFVLGHSVDDNNGKPLLTVDLKYRNGQGVIDKIERVSRPGLRCYRANTDIPKVMGGLGVAIVSTSRGVMSDQKARAEGVGGEVLCFVS